MDENNNNPGCSFSISIGGLPILLGLGALAKYMEWVDWSWLTVILIAVGVWLVGSLLLFVPVILMAFQARSFVGKMYKEDMKEERRKEKEAAVARKKLLKEEAIAAEAARKAKEEYEKEKAKQKAESANNVDLSDLPPLSKNETYCALVTRDGYPVVYTISGKEMIILAETQEVLENFVIAKRETLPPIEKIAPMKKTLVDIHKDLQSTTYMGIVFLSGNRAKAISKEQIAAIINR